MKTFRFLGFEINFHLSIESVENITVALPSYSEDVRLVKGTGIPNFNTSDGKTKIVFNDRRTDELQEIDLPACKRASMVFITPSRDRYTNERILNRKMVLEIFR